MQVDEQKKDPEEHVHPADVPHKNAVPHRISRNQKQEYAMKAVQCGNRTREVIGDRYAWKLTKAQPLMSGCHPLDRHQHRQKRGPGHRRAEPEYDDEDTRVGRSNSFHFARKP